MDHCGEVYEAIQESGDVIVVPGNWWHGVLNLNMTVAVTQNFVCSENFDEVWMRTQKERPKLSQRWRENIFRWAPELGRRVAYIDDNLDRLWKESLRKYTPEGDESDSTSSSSSFSSSDTKGDIEWDGLERLRGQRRPADTKSGVSPSTIEDVCMEHTGHTPSKLLASLAI
ncbi:jumonji domain-containing protein 6 [Perkinsus chesapeaki]|uniref:Jumonji domain-containing protein 6 n=1 Tax=Perkinsus chesapeaki TaxID=330153 RepID=A0A7J6N175_PERCH|nr:jumonji domain-containing protein 6 [Perkinsus chesapeaki]